MTLSPDQFPNDDYNTGTKGEHAGKDYVPDDIREKPKYTYVRSLDQAAKNDIKIPGNVEEGLRDGPWTPEEQAELDARLNPNKKMSKGKKIGAAVAGLSLIGTGAAVTWGVMFGATGGGVVNMPPKTEPTVSAPPVPGGVNPVETTPGATSAPIEVIPLEDLSFTDKNGNKQTYEELKASIRLGAYEYGNGSDALEAFIEIHMNNMVDGYRPDAAEVKSVLGLKPDEQIGVNQYIEAGRKRSTAFDHLYDTPGGDLYNAMHEISDINMQNWATSLEDSTKPYDPMTMEYDPINSIVSLSNSTGTSKYKLTGPHISVSVDSDPQYEIPGRTVFSPVKK